MSSTSNSAYLEHNPIRDRIADYLAGAGSRALTPDVAEKARHHLLDTVAAIVSGSALEPGLIAVSYGEKYAGRAEATIAGSRVKADIFTAALVNGMSAHADETDDFHVASITHPGSAVVPAALALGEARKLSGARFLAAVVAGYDICPRATMSIDATKRFAEGGATHGIGGLFGAAAASAVMLGLDRAKVIHLLSYTSQQASGMVCWRRDPDHIEKAFDFSGAAARNGVQTATMVEHGMTGVPDALEGRHGYFKVHGRGFDPMPAWADLGKRPAILDAAIKKWCVGSPIQAPLDAVEAIRAEHPDLDHHRIKSVILRLPSDTAVVVDNGPMPDVNCQHLVAVAIIDGRLSFHSAHDEARMSEPVTKALRDRTTLVHDDSLVGAMPPRQGIVEIMLDAGTALRHHAKAVRGTPFNPMTWDEVVAKAHDLMAPVIGEAASRQVVETVRRVDTLGDIGDLARLMAKP
jgi:2-methylcitrate dehydratase PrpD